MKKKWWIIIMLLLIAWLIPSPLGTKDEAPQSTKSVSETTLADSRSSSASVSSATTPKPTATPRPTYTPRSTNTPRPTKTPKPTNTPAPRSNEKTYVLNMNTHKFHYPSCSSVDQMKESNKWIYTGTRDEIIKMGYDPCKRCKP